MRNVDSMKNLVSIEQTLWPSKLYFHKISIKKVIQSFPAFRFIVRKTLRVFGSCTAVSYSRVAGV